MITFVIILIFGLGLSSLSSSPFIFYKFLLWVDYIVVLMKAVNFSNFVQGKITKIGNIFEAISCKLNTRPLNPGFGK